MVTPEERATFGLLGRIPDVIIKSSAYIVKQYMSLAEDARTVAAMRHGQPKIMAAKELENRYYGLMDEAMRELDTKGIKYERIHRPGRSS